MSSEKINVTETPHIEGGEILVTGGGGFIGSYVIDILKNKYDLVIVDNIKPISNDVKFYQIDLCNPFSISKDFDTCIHLAGIVGGIQYFTKHPVENIRDNPRITANVFDACINSGIKHVIYTSSSVVYQYQTNFPTMEAEVYNSPPPSSAYGLSKLIGEQFCKSYHEQYGIDYTILRPFNAYGPREAPDMEYAHVIPQLIKKVLNKQYPVEIYGSGEQTRTFTYGTDIAMAYKLCLENKTAINEIFNVAGDEELRIIDVLQMIWEKTGQSKELKIKNLPPFKDDVQRRFPSNLKIKEKLDWKPQISFGKGLEMTIEWIKSNSQVFN